MWSLQLFLLALSTLSLSALTVRYDLSPLQPDPPVNYPASKCQALRSANCRCNPLVGDAVREFVCDVRTISPTEVQGFFSLVQLEIPKAPYDVIVANVTRVNQLHQNSFLPVSQNIHRLSFMNATINEFDSTTKFELPKLLELDFIDSSIQKVTKSFEKIQQLEVLRFVRTYISEIAEDAFEQLTALKILSLDAEVNEWNTDAKMLSQIMKFHCLTPWLNAFLDERNLTTPKTYQLMHATYEYRKRDLFAGVKCYYSMDESGSRYMHGEDQDYEFAKRCSKCKGWLRYD